MKICTICKRKKSLKSFNKKNRSKDRHQPQCRSCGKKRSKAYYASNQKLHKANINIQNQRRRRGAQEYVLQHLRSNPCKDCGEDDVLVLEFDHVRGIKRSNRLCKLSSAKDVSKKAMLQKWNPSFVGEASGF